MARRTEARPVDFDTEDALVLTGQHLSVWRRLQGLTQVQASERAGVSRGSLVRLEAGHPGTSLDTYLRVLGALHITDRATAALDPYATDIGIARAGQALPKRVRASQPRRRTTRSMATGVNQDSDAGVHPTSHDGADSRDGSEMPAPETDTTGKR